MIEKCKELLKSSFVWDFVFWMLMMAASTLCFVNDVFDFAGPSGALNLCVDSFLIIASSLMLKNTFDKNNEEVKND
jgi:hypothetical protein